MRRSKAHESVREAREAVYRDVIFRAAEEVFAEHGFEAAKMQDIAERAELSVGVVYGVYAGKEALFRAVHEQRSAELIARTSALLEAGDSPVDVLRKGTEVTVRFFREHPSYLRMHLADRAAWVSPELGTEAQARASARGLALMAHVLAEGMEAQLFHRDDPLSAARIVMAIHQVRLAEWAESGFARSPDEVIAGIEELVRRAYVCA